MVADGDRLLLLLGRVRRRVLAQKALEGAVAGALLALVSADLCLLLLRAGVSSPLMTGPDALAGGVRAGRWRRCGLVDLASPAHAGRGRAPGRRRRGYRSR